MDGHQETQNCLNLLSLEHFVKKKYNNRYAKNCVEMTQIMKKEVEKNKASIGKLEPIFAFIGFWESEILKIPFLG